MGMGEATFLLIFLLIIPDSEGKCKASRMLPGGPDHRQTPGDDGGSQALRLQIENRRHVLLPTAQRYIGIQLFNECINVVISLHISSLLK